MKKKIVGLLRVSSDMQDFNSQKTGIESYCKKEKIIIDEWIEEFDVSGYSTKLEDRVGLQKIKEMAIKSEIDTLVVFNQYRIASDTSLLQYISFLNQLDVKIISATEGEINALDINSQLMSYVKLWMSESESIKTSHRVKNGILSKNNKNEFRGGKAPYGYKAIDGKLVVNEEEASIIKQVFEMSVDYGSHIVIRNLNEKGILKRGYKWNIGGLNYTLLNPIYTGYIRYNMMHEVNKDKTDKTRKKDNSKVKLQDYNSSLQIIEQDLFDRVQQAIKDRSHKKNKIVRQNTKTNQLLESLMYHKCWDGTENVMYIDYNYHKTNGLVTPIYICLNCKRNKPKDIKIKQSIVARKVHEEFEESIIDFFENIDIEKIRELLEGKLNKGIIEVKKELITLKEGLSKKNRALKNANLELEKVFLGESTMDSTVISHLITKLNDDISKLESEINLKQIEISRNSIDKIDIESILCKYRDFNKNYLASSLQLKKKLLKEIIDRVIWSEEDGLDIRLININ